MAVQCIVLSLTMTHATTGSISRNARHTFDGTEKGGTASNIRNNGVEEEEKKVPRGTARRKERKVFS